MTDENGDELSDKVPAGETRRIKWTCTYCNERNVSDWSAPQDKPATVPPENCKRCGTRRVR